MWTRMRWCRAGRTLQRPSVSQTFGERQEHPVEHSAPSVQVACGGKASAGPQRAALHMLPGSATPPPCALLVRGVLGRRHTHASNRLHTRAAPYANARTFSCLP